MAFPESVDLSAACGPLPSGGEFASDSYQGNLRITVQGGLSFTSGMRWVLAVEKPTVTASGRKGKPKKVVNLVGDADETVPDLLRQLADMWEIGNVEIGETYDRPGH